MMNPQVHFLLNKALESLGNSNLDSAELYLKKAAKLQANNPHVFGLLGIVYAQQGNYTDALKFLKDSLRILPKNHLTLSNLGNVYASLKDFENAIDFYKKSIKVNPNYVEAWSNVGNALQEIDRFEEAVIHYDKALSLNPNYAEAWSNKGNALQELKRFDEAIAHFDKALSLKPSYLKGYVGKGNTLVELKRFDEAVVHYDKALEFNPDYAEAHSAKGNALYELKLFDAAIFHHNKAVKLKPDYAAGWINKGVTVNELGEYDEAIVCFSQALSLKPDFSWVDGYLIHAKMKICNWSELSTHLESISKKIMGNQKVIAPFALLSLADDPVLHKKAAHTYVQYYFALNSELGSIPKYLKKEKLRIAYFSPDFRSHPVSHLTAELFELHDRSRFEVIAFSLQKNPPGDQMNVRLRNVFDQFIEVNQLSDLEVAKLARHLEIDIAIDLAGHTQHSRGGIFSYRAAPIQVNWLGYPGTTGTNFIDYLVADRTIIPISEQHMYSEKIAYLPNTYMVDDSKRTPSDRIFTREECNLPKNCFIYCCFNNDFKFNPSILDRWARILHVAQNSVLWISENNKNFQKNILAEFENRNIEPSRIIFAGRVNSIGDYLARYRLADLFLDTHPYGAHTTAIDSLKAGVPVLTLMGQSFASRVAASLLNTIDLAELITYSQEEYEALAIDFAMGPNKLEDVKLKLRDNLRTTPLFNTSLFAKNLEAIYLKMYDQYQLDLEPNHISLD